MINNLNVVFHHLNRQRLNTSLHIIGLTIGLSVCLVIALFIRYEFSVSTSIYGEGRLTVTASDEVRINAIGEPEVNVSGTSYINKGIIIGKADIRTMN